MTYVCHVCKRKECRRAFLSDDGGRYWIDRPPMNKYCPECEELGYKNGQKDKRGLQGSKNLAEYRLRKTAEKANQSQKG